MFTTANIFRGHMLSLKLIATAYLPKWCRPDCRYSAENLLELACGHGELRTLQRTLAAGGHRGRKALMGICEKLSQAPDHPDHDGPARAADRLPVEDRLQFVHRCHLAMHRPDLAGALESSNHLLWKPPACIQEV